MVIRDALTFEGMVMKDASGGYWSLCPELDVASQGESVREAKAMLREAVTGYLEVCFESNLPYLRPALEDPRKTEPHNVVESFRLRVQLSVKVRG